jgi:hypothetical protein
LTDEGDGEQTGAILAKLAYFTRAMFFGISSPYVEGEVMAAMMMGVLDEMRDLD